MPAVTERDLELLVTENGYFRQEAPDRHGKIRDYDRIDYLYRHLEQCIRARKSGVPLTSYYVWSFLDDLEWTAGYGTRMGLIMIDHETKERICKESVYWYSKVPKNRCLVDE